jgi:hypothetical protein
MKTSREDPVFAAQSTAGKEVAFESDDEKADKQA